jgi:virginiamycin B lyase
MINYPSAITAGPDGALWFTDDGGIGRITTAGVVTHYDLGSSDMESITVGPDGALWFTNRGNNSIGRVTTAGIVTNYTGSGIYQPQGIVAGPSGTLWFTNRTSIGRITTAGVVAIFPVAGIEYAHGIAAGPDGAMWFTDNGELGAIGRITTTVTPSINNIAPSSGAAGTRVTISGANLSNAIRIAFNGTPASIVSDTTTKIVVTVPAGATTGHITVTALAGAATSNGTFRVT